MKYQQRLGQFSTKLNEEFSIMRLSQVFKLAPALANRVRAVGAITACALISSPSYAQVARVNVVVTNILNLIQGLSVVLFTLALIWVGYKMAFQEAKWSEVSNVGIGGAVVGAAGGLATWLVN
jgi:type IV secretion system protein VirB2